MSSTSSSASICNANHERQSNTGILADVLAGHCFLSDEEGVTALVSCCGSDGRAQAAISARLSEALVSQLLERGLELRPRALRRRRRGDGGEGRRDAREGEVSPKAAHGLGGGDHRAPREGPSAEVHPREPELRDEGVRRAVGAAAVFRAVQLAQEAQPRRAVPRLPREQTSQPGVST